MAAVLREATECPVGLRASGELCVQCRQFLSLTLALSLITLFCSWLSDLCPQLKNTHHCLTFTGNKINSGLPPWDKVLFFSGISSLPLCYQITFNALKLSWASLTLLWLGGLAGGTVKTGRTDNKLALFSVAGCLNACL